MKTYRIALANIRFATTPQQSIDLATNAIEQAAAAKARIICFPECFIPGLRCTTRHVAPPDGLFLARARNAVAAAAAKVEVTVIMGTERLIGDELRATALVINRDGTIAGFQDKVQIDPAEEGTYEPGSGRQIFQDGELTFGVAICHEGWRYPETVRWAAMRGASAIMVASITPITTR